MALQYIRPDADSADGSWTNQADSTTDLFDSIDETSAGDTDYIKSSHAPAAEDIVKLRLSNPANAALPPMKVRYRFKKRGEENTSLTLKVYLVQGASTTIASWEHADITTSYVDGEQTLTTPQFNAISDFNDLFLWFGASSQWWLVDSEVDMDFENDRYRVEGDSAGADCIFLMHANGADAATTFFDAVGGHTITVTGNTQVDTAQSKFGGASALFDGSGDHLDISNPSDFSLGNGDFTIDFWIRFNGLSQFPVPFGFSHDTLVGHQIQLGSALLNYQTATGLSWVNRISGGTTLSTGTWYHVEIARSGSNTKMFLDGVQEGSTYTTLENFTCDQARVGTDAEAQSTSRLNGWIDEFRVRKGTAAHTSNFTPPTRAYSEHVAEDLLSISRASTGYAKNADGTLTSFSTDTLRIGVGTGLLVEGARTNFVLQSQDYSSTSYWAVDRQTPTTGQSAPDGTSTATKFVPVVSDVDFKNLQSFTSPATTANTRIGSFFLKDAGYPGAQLVMADGVGNMFAKFNTSTETATLGSVGGGWSGASCGMEEFSNGWWRCWLVGTSTNATGTGFNIQTMNASEAVQFFADGTSGIIVWGAQIEEASFVSSYIPTTSSSATRAADRVASTGSLSAINSASGFSYVVSMGGIDANNTLTDIRILGDNALDADTYISRNSTSNNSVHSFSAGGADLIATFGSGDMFSPFKAGYAQSAGSPALVGNAGTVDLAPTTTITMTDMTLGYHSATIWHGYFKRLTAWDSRLADATLQGFTNP